MSRPPIQAEVRRAVLVEASHRCAIPRCLHPDVDVHHIVPWEKCQKHEYRNLIALCPNCHRRAHKGEIDAKSLLQYKSFLIASFRSPDATIFSAPVVEAKRRMYEVRSTFEGGAFDFEFPEFYDAEARIASKNIEAWGLELLSLFRRPHEGEYPNATIGSPSFPLAWLTGRYQVIRRDARTLSVRYEIEQMYLAAAHRGRETRVQNFLLAPFQPLTLNELLFADQSIEHLSELVRCELLRNNRYLDREHVIAGTSGAENLSCFTLGKGGLEFIFDEYCVASYAEGQQRAHISYDSLYEICRPDILAALVEQGA